MTGILPAHAGLKHEALQTSGFDCKAAIVELRNRMPWVEELALYRRLQEIGPEKAGIGLGHLLAHVTELYSGRVLDGVTAWEMTGDMGNVTDTVLRFLQREGVIPIEKPLPAAYSWIDLKFIIGKGWRIGLKYTVFQKLLETMGPGAIKPEANLKLIEFLRSVFAPRSYEEQQHLENGEGHVG